MSRFCGIVGFVSQNPTRPGKYEQFADEREYYGDIFRNTRRFESGVGGNDNLVLNNQISIVADDYAYDHPGDIRYVRWMGACWTVTNVEIQRPRLLLTVGGVYHG